LLYLFRLKLAGTDILEITISVEPGKQTVKIFTRQIQLLRYELSHAGCSGQVRNILPVKPEASTTCWKLMLSTNKVSNRGSLL
jgi:hypothetical protein